MLKTILFYFTLLLLSFSIAQTDEFVEADAHEHGVALMTLVVENDMLTMDFISPAINIVGFEYAPKTDEEKAVVSQALVDLGNVDDLFSFSNRASCSMLSSSIASELSEADGHDEEHHEGEEEHHDEGEEGEHHDEDGEEHHEGEEEEHHDGEKEEHHDEGEEGEEHDEHGHDEEESVHSEFHASYTFTCNNVNRLAEIDLKGLFEQYPNVLDLDLQYVTEDTQGAIELNPSQTVLKF